MACTRLERGLRERVLPDPLDVVLVLVLVVRVPRMLRGTRQSFFP